MKKKICTIQIPVRYDASYSCYEVRISQELIEEFKKMIMQGKPKDTNIIWDNF